MPARTMVAAGHRTGVAGKTRRGPQIAVPTQASVGAGGDVQQVETAVEQEGVEGIGVGAAGLTNQGIVVVEGEAGLFVGLKHAPGEQGAHVELAGPGLLEDR